MRKQKIKGVEVGDIAEIFSNIEELSEIHSLLYKKIDSIINDDLLFPFISGIGECFLDIVCLFYFLLLLLFIYLFIYLFILFYFI